MAIKNKFIHFKTRAAFNANVPNPALTADEGNAFYNYTTFIKDTKEIYTHGTFYKCDISAEEVEALVTSKGYITEDDIPVLSGGAAATSGQYVSGVTVSGHTVTVTKAALPSAATVAPKASGTAAVGTSTKYAREDHVHPLQTTVSGNAGTATKLATPRVIAIAGAVSGSATFDGSTNISISTTLANIDASKITSGTLSADRLPEIPISKIPAAALERLYVVESQSAAVALKIQEGDVVQIGSGGPMYFCISESASTFATKFKVFTAGVATSVPWSGVTGAPTKLSQFTNDSGFITSVPAQTWNSITGKPSTFTPSAHTQAYTTLTGSTTTANQAIVSSGTANGWTLKTLGSLAFSSATVPTKTSQLTNDSGFLTSVPAQSWSSITGKPTFATVATSGSYNDLTNKPTIPSVYTLPTASASTLGGVKIGSGISISSGVISATYSSVGAAAASHTHTASQVTGLATVATSGSYNDLTNKPSIPSLSGYATQSWVTSQGYLTSIPAATSSAYGGIQIGYTTSGKNYAVQLSNGKAYVNVPWTDTNITYSAGTNISISGTTINCTYSYTLPTASSSVLGGVKVGSNITLSSGTISLSKSNVTSALGYTPANTSDIPEIPIALPNPYALTINGTSYTGSSAVLINTARILLLSTLDSAVVSAGYSYNNTSSRTISALRGFSSGNPDSVIISTAKITFTASNVIKMDGLANLSGTYYIYCLSYMANGKVAVNGAVYA